MIDDKNNTLLCLNGDGCEVPLFKGVNVKFEGHNPHVEIQKPNKINKLTIIVGSNCRVHIGSNIKIINSVYIWATAEYSTLHIGDNCLLVDLNVSLKDEKNLSITIGNDCMTSSNVAIRSSDGHTIYDINNKQILNRPSEIIIEDHVWLGRGVEILKNTHIPKDCIVGMGSVVTKKFNDPNCVLVGRPAKVVRSGVNWSTKTTDEFDAFLKKQEINRIN